MTELRVINGNGVLTDTAGREHQISAPMFDLLADYARRNDVTVSQLLWLMADVCGMVDQPIASRKAPSA